MIVGRSADGGRAGWARAVLADAGRRRLLATLRRRAFDDPFRIRIYSTATTWPASTSRWQSCSTQQSAGALDRAIHTSSGKFPGATFLPRLVACDGGVHGWDLATATGQRWNLEDDLVAEIDGFASKPSDPAKVSGRGTMGHCRHVPDVCVGPLETPADRSTMLR